MTKLLAKKKFAAKTDGPSFWRMLWQFIASRWLILSATFVTMSLVLLVFFLFHNQTLKINNVENYMASLTEYVSKKENGKHDAQINKRLAQNDDDKLPVHFEFYNVLPNMQVTPSMASDDNMQAMPLAQAIKPAIKRTQKTTVAIAKKTNIDSSIDSKTLISAQELERELSKHIHIRNKYIIQLGMFKNESTALRYQNALTSAGFAVTMSKETIGDKIMYRIQQGPFFDMNSAKLAQKKLQQKGHDALVRKIG